MKQDITSLLEQLRRGGISRRQFIKTAGLLGLSMAAIDTLLAGCAPTPQVVKEVVKETVVVEKEVEVEVTKVVEVEKEVEKEGWIGPKRPRMVAVQAEGFAPMVKAFLQGREFAEPWQRAKTIADGLRVPAAVGDFLILRALRESGGTAVAVSDQEIIEAANLIGRTQGMFVCPEGAAMLVALQCLCRQGWIGDDETVLLFNTGSGLKYAHLWAWN